MVMSGSRALQVNIYFSGTRFLRSPGSVAANKRNLEVTAQRLQLNGGSKV